MHRTSGARNFANCWHGKIGISYACKRFWLFTTMFELVTQNISLHVSILLSRGLNLMIQIPSNISQRHEVPFPYTGASFLSVSQTGVFHIWFSLEPHNFRWAGSMGALWQPKSSVAIALNCTWSRQTSTGRHCLSYSFSFFTLSLLHFPFIILQADLSPAYTNISAEANT